jgi:hypothetical protein
MDQAVACSLNAGDHEERLRQLADLSAKALMSRQPIPGGERLLFIDTSDTERALRAAIDAEASCCSFLTMTLARERTGLVLDVTGPGLAQPIIAELFASARGPRRRRLGHGAVLRRGSPRRRSDRGASLPVLPAWASSWPWSLHRS